MEGRIGGSTYRYVIRVAGRSIGSKGQDHAGTLLFQDLCDA